MELQRRRCRRRNVEAWRYAVCVATWRYEGSLQVQQRGGRKVCRFWRRVGVEVWSSRGALQACRRGGIEVRSSGGTEHACRRGGMEVQSS